MGYGIVHEKTGEIELYRFGRSRQIFRGPRPDLARPYISFVGGSEPFGKFVRSPFPGLVARKTGQNCANFGTPGAGPGFFLKDPLLLEALSKSQVCVVQIMDAAPLSNRMYSVFPRRNMRLRSVSTALTSLFPQVDFGKFRYVSAMLRVLKSVDVKAYEVVVAEQRSAWLARMLELLESIETTKILLWIKPEGAEGMNDLVNQEMVDVVAKNADHRLEISIPQRPTSLLNKDTGWMTSQAHMDVAARIANELHSLQTEKGPA